MKTTETVEVQTVLTGDEIDCTMDTAKDLLTENDMLQKPLEVREIGLFCKNSLTEEEDIHFFTGLPNCPVLKVVLSMLSLV